MSKKILVLALIALFLTLAVSAYSAKINRAVQATSVKAPMKYAPFVGTEEVFSSAPYIPGNPNIITVSPGDTAGWTQYDYQSNGSSGNRIVVDALGGVHVDWMNAITFPAPRQIYYNFYDQVGHQWSDPGSGTSVSYRNGDGYCQIAATSDGRAVVAYHHGGNDSIFVAVNTFGGSHAWDYYHPVTRFGTRPCIWPYVSVDRNGRIHVISTDTTTASGILAYTRSTNGGSNWSAAQAVDTLTTISGIVTSSPVSDKVAIVYTHPTGTLQAYNDVYYIVSNDGLAWDFGHAKVNVTGYATDDDSLMAYTDCDAVYDYNDDLHIIWSAWYIGADSGLYYNQRLLHYDITSGTVSRVTTFDSTWYDTQTWCDFGGWNFGISKMSIGVDPTNNALFTTYTSWNIADCAMSGFANGDIFMNYSVDGGATWTMKGNLTDSHTDSCQAGDCDSDHWSSLAEKVDAKLHVFYVNDKDAGGIPQSEGSVTDNPMLYLGYTNPVRTSAAPLAPRPNFPYNDSTYNSGYFLFDWNDPVGVMHYVLQIDTDPAFAAPILYQDSAYTYSELVNENDSLEAGIYFWRVKGVGLYGDSPWSPVWEFAVAGSSSGSGYIVGRVNNQAGAPLADVIATVRDGGNVIVGVDTTSALGLFEVTVPAGTYHALLTKPGFNDLPVNDIIIVMDSIKAMVLVLPPSGPACSYVVGDVNNNRAFNGLDVTYSVGYFKGGAAPGYSCECTAGHTWFVAGDVNASCNFNGLDVTYMVGYFKGGPACHPCGDCPPNR